MTRYSDQRERIQSGDLLAWRGRSALGRFIRSVTGGSWSHVGIAWRLQGRVFVLEATQAGVGLRALSEALPFDHIEVDNAWSDTVEVFALSQLGRPYSAANAVLAPALQAWPSRGRQCAQYAGDVLHLAGINVPRERTPGALVEAMLDAGCRLTAVSQDSP